MVYLQIEGPNPNYGAKIILALLDSGAQSSMLLTRHSEGLNISKNSPPVKWSTPGKGGFETKCQTQIQFTILETTQTYPTSWTVHVTDDLSGYGMLIGRDLLDHLRIDLRFSSKTIHVGNDVIPFKTTQEGIDLSPGLNRAISYI